MKLIRNLLGGLLIIIGFIAALNFLHAQETGTPSQSAAPDSIVQLTAESQGLSLVATGDLPEYGTFWNVTTNGIMAPWPCPPPNAANLPIYAINSDSGEFLVDSTGGQVNMDGATSVQEAVAALAGAVADLVNQVQTPPSQPASGSRMASGMMTMDSFFSPLTMMTTNDLWLQLNGVTNDGTGWTANLTINTPWNDTNLTHDLLYTTSIDSPIDWRFLMRCTSTNVVASGLCEAQGFFALTQTNGALTVSTNATAQQLAQQLAQLLVPPWVTVTNATYTGAIVARGTFAGGNGCGLPIDTGVVLSSGQITNAIGPNDDDGSIAEGSYIDGINYTGPSDLWQPGDADLSSLVGGGSTYDAAVLEFDIISTNSFTLEFQYIFASEEYPEWIGRYNDPMAIFVSTNRVGTNWINSITNDFALVPGTTNVPVSVNNINGGCIDPAALPTNPQYYVDNCDPYYVAATNAAPAPEFNIQYDGMTVLLTAQTFISANVTNHVKIAIADYNDTIYDSAIFLDTWSPSQCP